jgi:serine/threonine protein kinase/formylglycine-generating enzyme required for sulfatase activity
VTALDESWISDVAARYETAFKSGLSPEIGDFLQGTTEPGRTKLLAELLRVDVSLRQARGDRPSLAEYVGKFPRDSRTVLEALSAVGLAADEVDLLSDSSAGPRAGVPSLPGTEELASSPGWPLPTAPLKSTVVGTAHSNAASPIPRVDGFESLALIGEGGMGKVYRARSPSLNHLVALKILPEDCADDPERVTRFRNEAELAASIDHPNVVGVMQLLMGPPPVLVMALVDGPDLGRLLLDLKRVRAGREPVRDHPFLHLDPAEQLKMQLSWLDQIVDAVACVNAMGILHRDLKPSNILVDGRGRARLTDFGLARLIEESLLTRTGQPMGTVGFSSPEQAAGQKALDSRADQFSLAATIYQVLTMHLPYGRPRPGTRPAARPTPPRTYQPKISADLETVILRALQPDREERYAATDEFRDQWMAAREGRPIEAWRRRPMRWALHWARNHAWGVSDAIAVVALLMILAFVSPRSWWDGGAQSAEPTSLKVLLETQPAGARAVAVPLDPRTGEPDAGNAVHLRAGRATLPPGDYLVEVVWPDRRFHQVYRRVPTPGQPNLAGYNHTGWTAINAGEWAWPPVLAPPPDVGRGMAALEGKDEFQLEPDRPADGPGPRPFLRDVGPFLLDPTEVTVGAYGGTATGKPNEPVTMVCYDDALAYAERVGKRLPTEAEFEFAATLGGLRRYPWGNEPPTSWPFGPAGSHRRDMLPTVPPVFGLYSNVAEWTCTALGSDPALAALAILPTDALADRVVCGGTPEVVAGKLPETGVPPDLGRQAQSRAHRMPGLGFRCARSRAPLYLVGP